MKITKKIGKRTLVAFVEGNERIVQLLTQEGNLLGEKRLGSYANPEPPQEIVTALFEGESVEDMRILVWPWHEQLSFRELNSVRSMTLALFRKEV